MVVLKTVLAALATAVGVFGSLMFVVFLLASTPNMKPEDARRIFRVTWAVVGGGTLCLIGAIWLLVAGYPVWGGLVGILPLAAFVLGLIVASIISA